MADLAHASENDNDLHGDQDAMHWAERFACHFEVVRLLDGRVVPDVTGLMLAWFAGAIETGKMYNPEENTVEENFQVTARTMVMNYFNSHKDMTDNYVMTFSDTYVVWFCKTLQNWKALVSTNVPDGVYYEVTHNGEGDIGQTYLDVYKKIENIAMPDEALRIETSATGPDEENITPGEGVFDREVAGQIKSTLANEKLPAPPMKRYESPNPLIKRDRDEEVVVPAEPWTAGNIRF